jgi:hypothetical protein
MALINVTNIPSDRVPFIDERTGLVSRAWYRFLLQLFNLTGNGTNPTSLSDLQVGPPPLTLEEVPAAIVIPDFDTTPSQNGLLADVDVLQSEINGIQSAPPPFTIDEITSIINGGYLNPPFGITLTGSPFTYRNTALYTIDVLVGGSIGGVTNLEFSRNGSTWFGTGSFYGQITLSPNDYIRITYTSAPTVTGIPR